MRISLCMIIKDDSELEKLKKAVESAISYVDGVYISATGFNVGKIEKYCQQQGLHYSYFKWCDDFSAARNFNFSQAPQDTDYIFWMDADDILVGGEYLREIADLAKQNAKDLLFFTYWYGCEFKGQPILENLTGIQMQHMRERLIRPGVTEWKGRLHETPVPREGAKNSYTQVKYTQNPKTDYEFPIAIMHTTLMDDLPEKTQRNLRILELQLKEERQKGEADPRTLLYLMKIYGEMDVEENWAKTIKMGQEYLDKSGWDEERGTCCEYMGIAYGRMGNLKKAVSFYHQAIAEWPHQPLLYIRLATALYNLKDYKGCKHWMDIASSMDLDKRYTSGMTNIKAMKVMFAELLVKYYYNVEKDTKKALEGAKMLAVEMPTEVNINQVRFLEDICDLNEACLNVDHLAMYLDSIGASSVIPQVLDVLPEGISDQPFASKLRQAFTPSKKWGDKEIAYFASFGGPHFEKWDESSLETGIGGSETAVIQLSKHWANLGYMVTIYGDPKRYKDGSFIFYSNENGGGVRYLPWYYFNKNDFFNILIQWRGWGLCDKVKARKFLVDLHDMYSPVDINSDDIRYIDKFMVKSNYHRNLAPKVPDEKWEVISNGI